MKCIVTNVDIRTDMIHADLESDMRPRSVKGMTRIFLTVCSDGPFELFERGDRIAVTREKKKAKPKRKKK